MEYLRGVPIDRLKFKGRWRSLASLEHYIQECLTFLGERKLRGEVRARIALLSQGVQVFWRRWAREMRRMVVLYREKEDEEEKEEDRGRATLRAEQGPLRGRRQGRGSRGRRARSAPAL